MENMVTRSAGEICGMAWGLEVSAPDGEGMSKSSGSCRLIGNNVDVTIRRLLTELGYERRDK
jgi:hypothetical protein